MVQRNFRADRPFDETGGASLTVTDPNGCITSSTVNLSEFEVVPPQILGEITFCSGQTTLLTGEDGYVSYEWSDGSIEQSLSLSTGGSYQLTALDTNSCYSNTTVEVIENALPEPQIVGPLTFVSATIRSFQRIRITRLTAGPPAAVFHPFKSMPKEFTAWPFRMNLAAWTVPVFLLTRKLSWSL